MDEAVVVRVVGAKPVVAAGAHVGEAAAGLMDVLTASELASNLSQCLIVDVVAQAAEMERKTG